MINHNYRAIISQFIPLQQMGNEPRTVNLTKERMAGEFIGIDAVPGNSNSSIEKMTHPLAGCCGTEKISPYMIVLLSDQKALDFAEKVLQSPRKRLLDSLGIDENKVTRHIQLNAKLETLTRFYSRDAGLQPKKFTLNGRPFIEQEPTKPYFVGQKIITPDFTLYRTAQEQQKQNLLLCKTRDDSELYFNQAPITELKVYNDDIFAKESMLRSNDNFLNKTQYVTEMIEYLTYYSQPGDILVQNSLETSSDRNTPHLQFIPGDVPLPLFYRSSQVLKYGECQQLDWYLPTLTMLIDSRQYDWKVRAKQIQTVCQNLLVHQHISTTPVFKYQGDGMVSIYLIFKQDGRDLAPEILQQAPGWLESCGIFIANTQKAATFSTLGAAQYYNSYGVTDKEKLLTSLEYQFDNLISDNNWQGNYDEFLAKKGVSL